MAEVGRGFGQSGIAAWAASRSNLEMRTQPPNSRLEVCALARGLVHFPQRRIWPVKVAVRAPGLLPYCRQYVREIALCDNRRI